MNHQQYFTCLVVLEIVPFSSCCLLIHSMAWGKNLRVRGFLLFISRPTEMSHQRRCGAILMFGCKFHPSYKSSSLFGIGNWSFSLINLFIYSSTIESYLRLVNWSYKPSTYQGVGIFASTFYFSFSQLSISGRRTILNHHLNHRLNMRISYKLVFHWTCHTK